MELKERPWDLGCGPILLQPGEQRRIDVQPKCKFTCDMIRSYKGNTSVHLLALYVGKDECLHLLGDASIDLGQNEIIELLNIPASDPALTISVDLINRGAEERMVDFSIFGRACY